MQASHSAQRMLGFIYKCTVYMICGASYYFVLQYYTVFQNGKSDVMTVFDIWLVESGYWSLIYVQEAFP